MISFRCHNGVYVFQKPLSDVERFTTMFSPISDRNLSKAIEYKHTDSYDRITHNNIFFLFANNIFALLC